MLAIEFSIMDLGSTTLLCSLMVRISLFHREDRGSIPRIGIIFHGNTDSGRKVKALDLSSGATRTVLWKTMKGIGTPLLEVCGT